MAANRFCAIVLVGAYHNNSVKEPKTKGIIQRKYDFYGSFYTFFTNIPSHTTFFVLPFFYLLSMDQLLRIFFTICKIYICFALFFHQRVARSGLDKKMDSRTQCKLIIVGYNLWLVTCVSHIMSPFDLVRCEDKKSIIIRTTKVKIPGKIYFTNCKKYTYRRLIHKMWWNMFVSEPARIFTGMKWEPKSTFTTFWYIFYKL